MSRHSTFTPADEERLRANMHLPFPVLVRSMGRNYYTLWDKLLSMGLKPNTKARAGWAYKRGASVGWTHKRARRAGMAFFEQLDRCADDEARRILIRARKP
jgi:hypothetical protein